MAREVDSGKRGFDWESRDYTRYPDSSPQPRQPRSPFRPLPPRQIPRQYRGQYRTVSR